MSSSGRPRARRRNGSRSTARRGRLPRRSGTAAATVALQPDADSSLADGVVVETRLVARVLGLRLLRVDGVVLLSPGRVREVTFPESAPRPAGRVAGTQDGRRAGERLALAERLIASTGSRLERARSDQPPVTGRFS